MEEIHLEEQKEIVLTYRQADREEPVQLRYERELPQRLRREEPAPSAPPREEKPAPWRSAIAPPERAKKGRWGVRLFVGVSLLLSLVCLGVGIWYVGQYGWALPESPPSADRRPAEEPFSGERYHWDYDGSVEDTTIPRYPIGGETRLMLSGALEYPVLAPGEVYAQVNPSVVTVLGAQKGFSSVGTGVIFSEDGYILTNCHVIAGCSRCTVWVTEDYGAISQWEAKLVGCDEDADLAVLKVEAEGLPAAEFGVSDDLAVGDPVYAIGNPLGTELRNTFTNGIVSAVNRDVDADGVTMTLIQTNTALNSDNSGGPLINQYGQVVGVNTIKMMSEDDTIEGLGFAIPSSLAVRWVNELIEFGELQPQPILGVTINGIPEILPDGTQGLSVIEVTEGLSGDRAGVRAGDCVVAFHGQPVSSNDQILAIRRSLHVGDEVIIRVYRDGEYLDLTMIMMAAEDK